MGQARDLSRACIWVVIAIATMAGCRGGEPTGPGRPSSSGRAGPDGPAGTDDNAPEWFEGTAGITEKKRDDLAPAVLRAVRTGRHEAFDRTVFEFQGTETPGYHLEYIDKPVRRCGSGDPTAIAGDGWLEIRMSPAQAHDEAGKATIADRERMPKLVVLEEIEQTCDFEGHVTWALGLRSPNRYRVLELSNPPRLVVDVKH